MPSRPAPHRPPRLIAAAGCPPAAAASGACQSAAAARLPWLGTRGFQGAAGQRVRSARAGARAGGVGGVAWPGVKEQGAPPSRRPPGNPDAGRGLGTEPRGGPESRPPAAGGSLPGGAGR